MQKWLDYYGPFEAVVDGANVGLFSQKKFVPSKASCTMLMHPTNQVYVLIRDCCKFYWWLV